MVLSLLAFSMPDLRVLKVDIESNHHIILSALNVLRHVKFLLYTDAPNGFTFDVSTESKSPKVPTLVTIIVELKVFIHFLASNSQGTVLYVPVSGINNGQFSRLYTQ